MRTIVFAYHNIGVCALKVLHAQGIKVDLVITHQDNPNETIWFDSVKKYCQKIDIPTITPATGNDPVLFSAVTAIQPDWIFSFYYRHMLPSTILSLAKEGAYNLHGSLLPKYRGRVPVNWAVLHGETETGVTLHEMTEKPDAGRIVAQTKVPILPDETAFDVFNKLTLAAKQTLETALPTLLNHTAQFQANNVSQGSYFSSRKPEDGEINWNQSAQTVYNLHRAVAPPYPGAYTIINNKKYTLVKARLASELILPIIQDLPNGLNVVDNTIFGKCKDQGALIIHELLCDDRPISAFELNKQLNSTE